MYRCCGRMRQSTAIVICVRCLPVTLVSNIHIYSKGAVSDASIPHLNPIHQFFFFVTVQNITYMCAKVNSSNGCYLQTYSSGMQVEACVCTSKLGLIPCNTTATVRGTHILALVIALLAVFVRR